MADDAAELVRALKYGGWVTLAAPMGREMVGPARRLVGPSGAPPSLVPVPLSPARRRERGFNQAHLLAAELARATGWSLAAVLARRRTGRRQARSGRLDRATNVRGLFHCPPGTASAVAGRRVLLVDDVVTTGATSAACADALRRAGSSLVGVVSFARALHGPAARDEGHPL